MEDFIKKITSNETAQQMLETILVPSIKIIVIILLAFIISRILKFIVRKFLKKVFNANISFLKILDNDKSTNREREIRLEQKKQRNELLYSLVNSTISIIIWITAFVMCLEVTGINVGPLIAGAGILGVALGFGAQNLVRDFLSGILLILEDQFGVGDWIDVGIVQGSVEKITLRAVQLRGLDGTIWFVPNGEVRQVGNKSKEWSVTILDIGIAYDSDIDKASEIILSACKKAIQDESIKNLILEEPTMLGVQNLGESSVDLRVRVKTLPGEQWAISRLLRKQIKKDLDDANIEIPFPQHKVWLVNDDQKE